MTTAEVREVASGNMNAHTRWIGLELANVHGLVRSSHTREAARYLAELVERIARFDSERDR